MTAHALGAVTAGLLASVVAVPTAAALLAVPAGAAAVIGLVLIREPARQDGTLRRPPEAAPVDGALPVASGE
jgi:hypothetical protein